MAHRCISTDHWGPTHEPMHTRLLFALPLLAVVASPSQAKVLAEGKPNPGGFYWLTIKNDSGSIQYQCRKTSDTRIQKAVACNGAKAVKPS